ncbi:MAG TPA: hypothetical protein VN796_11675 [Acidimicrobiales bacterium]|nr:hypothetical protein [Acidimicrobiales bacterium]
MQFGRHFFAPLGACALIVLGQVGIEAAASSARVPMDTTQHWGSYSESSGNSQEVDTPTVLGRLNDVVAIQAGNASGMALSRRHGRHVYVWGLGANGALGIGGKRNALTSAVEVPGLPPIAAIGESDDTDVAVTTTGAVYGWGWNSGGQLCLGNTSEVDRPVLIPLLTGVVAAAGGGTHMTYLLGNGSIVACGENTHGQLGNGTFTDSTTPVTVTGLPAGTVTQISAGPTASAALVGGAVWDWGNNQYGQLGNGSTTDSDVPVEAGLPVGTTATEVYEGGDNSGNGQVLALTNTGVYGWGNDSEGQLGNGTTPSRVDRPTLASALPTGVTFTSVASGGHHGLGLDSSGNVWAWGGGGAGQIGNGTSSGNVLTPVMVLTGADMISATADTSVAHVP